ncbi:uncharacterized protein F4812DRAFT_411816 [Daldinia caldariorum]|uniref:uncharacterized protein n=1 Tax=Daldinia caldariorum TaxID=326644 RepID=UPI002007F744|nr:uncharacterized protein F4812DRAFT_411816 [Daldinia caldariorum]KAI1473164.1 hypothetical protein F4812DRAFT_411816 [Daldinia caldariorum]
MNTRNPLFKQSKRPMKMDHKQGKLNRILSSFAVDISSDIWLRSPEILAVYVGGSMLYLDETAIFAGTHPLYWNIAIIVNTKLDILKLVNKNRQHLLGVAGIVRQECPEELFQVPCPDSEYWSEVDAVRFAGSDKFGFTRSVVILSLEYFGQSSPRARSPTALNIYSYEDKRVYKSNRPGRVECQVLQACSLPNGFVILYDQWLYEDCTRPYEYRRDPSYVAFGQTADLLVGGVNLLKSPYGDHIAGYILNLYHHTTGERPTAKSLANSGLFSAYYTAFVNERLSSFTVTGDVLQNSRLEDVPAPVQQVALLGDTLTSEKGWDDDPSRSAEVLPRDFVEKYYHGAVVSVKSWDPLVEGELSRKWEISTVGKTGETVSMLCKETPFPACELERVVQASAYYPWVQIPRMSGSDLLCFPMVRYELESEIRIRYIEGDCNNWDDAETLLHVEMVKAEIMLNAYKKSLRDPAAQRKDSGEIVGLLLQNIGARETALQELYGDEIQLHPGVSVSIEEFLDMQWIINNERYPSLREMLDQAYKDIREAQYGPVVFGLGDASALHAMVSPKTAQGGRKVIFDDHQLSGYHPVMLDIARTFYFDVFFETVHLSTLPSRECSCIKYEVTKTAIEVTYAAKYDWLARAIAEIKMRCLVNSLEQEVKAAGYSFEALAPQLSSNILVLPALYQNFSGEPEAMIACLVNGIIMSRCRSWNDFRLGLKKLGFSI